MKGGAGYMKGRIYEGCGRIYEGGSRIYER